MTLPFSPFKNTGGGIKEVVEKIDEINKDDVKEIKKKKNIEKVEIEILCKENLRTSHHYWTRRWIQIYIWRGTICSQYRN